MIIQSLRLENFQSHKDTTLNLDPRFNAVVGTGNSGKTAIVRALSFVLFGQWNTSWVRHGAKFCRITLVTDSGVEVVREKGDKVNRYIITKDGTPQVYENFGSKIPTEVEQVLNIFTAKVGEKEELNLNLSNQLDPLFLLSTPGSYKAKVLGKLSKAHYLDHALREINKDKKKLSGEKSLIEKEIEVLQKDLESYVGLDEQKAGLDALNKRLSDAATLDSRLQKLKDLQRRMGEWKTAYLANMDALSALPDVPATVLDTLTKKVLQLQQIRALRDKIVQFKTKFADANSLLSELSSTKTLLTDKYLTLLKENKTCPTCFNRMDASCLHNIEESLK